MSSSKTPEKAFIFYAFAEDNKHKSFLPWTIPNN